MATTARFTAPGGAVDRSSYRIPRLAAAIRARPVGASVRAVAPGPRQRSAVRVESARAADAAKAPEGRGRAANAGTAQPFPRFCLCTCDLACRFLPHEVQNSAHVFLACSIAWNAQSQRQRAAQPSGRHQNETTAIDPLVDALVQI